MPFKQIKVKGNQEALGKPHGQSPRLAISQSHTSPVSHSDSTEPSRTFGRLWERLNKDCTKTPNS